MEISSTAFREITIDKKLYPHDVWIFPDGSIKRRDRNNHFVMEEFDILAETGPEVIIIGTGQ